MLSSTDKTDGGDTQFNKTHATHSLIRHTRFLRTSFPLEVFNRLQFALQATMPITPNIAKFVVEIHEIYQPIRGCWLDIVRTVKASSNTQTLQTIRLLRALERDLVFWTFFDNFKVFANCRFPVMIVVLVVTNHHDDIVINTPVHILEA